MKCLVEISSRNDIPQKVQDSGRLVVLKETSFKFLADYLATVSGDQMIYCFMWASLDCEAYLKIIEDYQGSLTFYRCSKGDGRDLPLSQAFLSRFNLCLSRKFKNPKIDLQYAGTDENQKLFNLIRRLFT